MQIECILKRPGGTRVTLEGIEYHFAPQADNAHVAEVESEPHCKRLLNIPEAYQPYRPVAAGVAQTTVPVNKLNTIAPTVPTPVAPPVLLGSSVHPESFNLSEGRTVQLGEVVARAQSTSGLTVEQWNALTDDERAAKIDATLDVMASEPPPAAPLDRAALAEQYKAKFGKAPHGKWTAEAIAQKIASGEA